MTVGAYSMTSSPKWTGVDNHFTHLQDWNTDRQMTRQGKQNAREQKEEKEDVMMEKRGREWRSGM